MGNVQNNLNIGQYKGKLVALFRASDTVLDCGQGTIIDFPSWKALREMLNAKVPEVDLTVELLLTLAGDAEEEVAAGLAEEVKLEPKQEKRRDAASEGPDAAKKPRLSAKEEVDPEAWKAAELGEYPNAIHLVSSVDDKKYAQLIQETVAANAFAYDVQWAPDFEEGSDNQIALVQLAFPITGNTYVLQLPMLGGWPPEIQRLFESSAVTTSGFAANEIDVKKFEISGISIDKNSLIDLQPWCEAEMGENKSVQQGWRVGLKRAAWCVLDFEMDKTSTVASSNWEREELTTAQVEYAAMDVWVALRLYQRLADVYK